MITYRGPLGDVRENPDDAFLQDIAQRTASYWAQGGGDSCLESTHSAEQMVFFYDEPFGFFLMMCPDYHVLSKPGIAVSAVEHRVGGEPMKVPSCSYVSRREALNLMREFVELGGRPQSVQWQNMYDIDFDHGY